MDFGNFLAVQRLGLCMATSRDTGSIPGWGTKILQVSGHGQIKLNKLMDFEEQCGWASSNLLKNLVKKRVILPEQEGIPLRLKLQLFSESLPLLYVPSLCNCLSQFLKINLSLSLSFPVSFSISPHIYIYL